MRLTGATTLANLTMQIHRDEPRYNNEKDYQASLQLYGRLTSIAGITGRHITWFEDKIMANRLYTAAGGSLICSKDLLVAPGTYDLKMAARITGEDRITTTEMPILVPAGKPGEFI